MNFFNPVFILAFVLILTVHEFAHAKMADYLGDPTPRSQGRLSLNPLSHLDWLGSLMLLFFGLGWAKPVPVNAAYFKKAKRDLALTAFAGPGANFLMAIVALVLATYLPGPESVKLFWNYFADISLFLMVFNMIPLGPLDGASVLRAFVPSSKMRSYDAWQERSLPLLAVFVVLDLFVLQKAFGFSILWDLLSRITYFIKASLLLVL